MGSCYSSQGSREVTLDSVDFPSSITTASSPSLFKMLLCSGNWNKKNKNKNKKKKKKRGILDLDENRSFGGSAEERELHRIPGRMFVSGGSDVACLFTQQGRKGINQDAMLVWENFSSENDTIFCGVFDGHGPYGHMVAKRVRDSLPLKLCSQWKANSSNDRKSNVVVTLDSEETASFSMDDEWCESLDDENVKLPQMYLPLKQSLLKAFKLMDKELKLHPTIDCFCSGTTAVTMVKRGQDLVIANVGDSRAVLGTRDKDNCLIAVQLTVDLKPNLPREAARIHRCKGRVFALPDEPEVPRVWLPNNDSPGLAMARAFGDFCLKDFGLISVPDVYYHHLTGRDEFIVLATDGVWDVLSNKEVIDIVASAPSNATAARALVDCAVRAWRLKFPTSKSDDCAVVCLFLEHPSAVNQVQEEENALEGRREELVEPTISTWKEREKTDGNEQGSYLVGDLAHSPVFLQNSCALRSSDEIVPVSESMEEKRPERCQSTRSLAECISTAEDEEWSALEGVTRVNSLLNIPRFLSGDKKAATWRKWL